MRLLPGIGSELADAIRRVNAHALRTPEARRSSAIAISWPALEDELERLCATGDRDSALAAIDKWEAETLTALGADR